MTRRRAHPRIRSRPGVALLLALAIVVVLTAFMSELFLDTGLETRAIANFRDSDQAQSLARSAFKALDLALKNQSEQDFQFGYTRLDALLKLSPIPFEEGLLTRLQVTSLDGLFNVNELADQRQGTPEDARRWALFRNAIAAIPIPAEIDGQIIPPVTERQTAALYGALVDWIDADDNEYIAPLGAPGAERRAYGNDKPEYDIKNAALDRLEEMRLVRGFAEAHLPWAEVEKRFTALPKSPQTGQLDVNLAAREEIVRFLTERRTDDPKALENPAQKNINDLADKADAIAVLIAPEGLDRPYFATVADLQKAMQTADAGTQGAAAPANALNLLFSTCSKYLRVRSAVDVNGTVATLDAQLQLTRGSGCGPASKIDVLRITLR
jgi:type II secretory pathway component PulK